MNYHIDTKVFSHEQFRDIKICSLYNAKCERAEFKLIYIIPIRFKNAHTYTH